MAVDASGRITALISGTVTVTGALTDAQLRATPVPVSGTVAVSNMIAAVETGLAKDVNIGIVTETAPGTDTASSGLNGRLQRIAQRLTSLIALLPGSLGQKARAASLAVTLSSEDITALTPVTGLTDAQLRATPVPVSGTVTANTGLSQPLTDAQLRASAVPVSLASVPTHAVTGSGTFTTKETRATTPTQTSVSVTNTNTVVLASNVNRLGATMYNEGSATCYLKLGATATTSAYTVQMASGGYYEVPYGYTGAIDGITSASTAQLRITEVT